MKLKRKLDSLEGLPEEAKGLYTKLDDGTFGLNLEVEGLIAEENVKGIVKNRDELLAEKKALAEKLSGVDFDEYEQLKSSAAEIDRQKQKLEGDFETRERQLLDKHSGTVEKLETRISELSSSLNNQTVESAIKDGLIRARANDTGNALLPNNLRGLVEVVDEDGCQVVRVKGEDGRPRLTTQKGETGYMSVAELVSELRDNKIYAHCFEPDNVTGSGAAGSRGGGGAPRYTRDQLRDPAVFDKAFSEAEEAGREILMQGE